MDDKVILHYGVLGMKWGRRRGRGPSVKTRVRRTKKAISNSKVAKNFRNKAAWKKLLTKGGESAVKSGLGVGGITLLLTGDKKKAAKAALRSASLNAVFTAAIGTYQIGKTGKVRFTNE